MKHFFTLKLLIHTYPGVCEPWKGPRQGRCRACQRLLSILIVIVSFSHAVHAYSVLTHEEIVDLVWEDQIRPLLLARFPGLSEEQIREAHAHAYGGSVIQDLGYYPFGSKDFSNLVHYVRSGDFVRELVRQSQNANEYAFAVGALAALLVTLNELKSATPSQILAKNLVE